MFLIQREFEMYGITPEGAPKLIVEKWLGLNSVTHHVGVYDKLRVATPEEREQCGDDCGGFHGTGDAEVMHIACHLN